MFIFQNPGEQNSPLVLTVSHCGIAYYIIGNVNTTVNNTNITIIIVINIG